MAHLGPILFTILFGGAVSSSITLQQLQIIFRHGDRTPEKFTMYPRDPHINDTWYPDGYGALTMLGKMQLYELGRSLRHRYNEFLGRTYLPEVLDAWSTNSNRTKMSLELVLAGLYPPISSQLWNKALPWQPIPYNYAPMENDKVLRFPGAYCCKYSEEYRKASNSQIVQEFLKSNDKLINYINHHSGLQCKNTWDLLVLYYGLFAEEKTERKLPEWTKEVYPEFLKQATLLEYGIMTHNDEMLKGSGGSFLRKVINDARAKIHGSLVPKERKLFLYSGHDYNIVFPLAALKVFTPHLPPYASYIIFELHKIDNMYGFKIFYQDYTKQEPQLQFITGCGTFCPFDKFVEIKQNVIPKGDNC